MMVVMTTLYEFSSFITGRPDDRDGYARRTCDRHDPRLEHSGGSCAYACRVTRHLHCGSWMVQLYKFMLGGL